MIDNIEIICKNYTPTERIEWTNSILNDNKPKTLFLAKLYNRTRKKKNYFMSLFLRADEKKDQFTLLVRGNLNNWYSQKIMGRDLTYKEYTDGIKLLLSEIEVNENKLMTAKIKNIDVRINIDFPSVHGSNQN